MVVGGGGGGGGISGADREAVVMAHLLLHLSCAVHVHCQATSINIKIHTFGNVAMSVYQKKYSLLVR